MGRQSGGLRGGSSKNIGKTEYGLSARERASVIGRENLIRRNKDESLHAIDGNGKEIISIGGKGAAVKYTEQQGKMFKDKILTHNHPRSIGATGIKSIGNSFSKEDIITAVRFDAKEIRAVTPTYTFSVKRPKGGWGGNYKEIAESFSNANKLVHKDMLSYLDKRNWTEQSIARAEVTHFDRVMKRMANQYGWRYSHKKG